MRKEGCRTQWKNCVTEKSAWVSKICETYHLALLVEPYCDPVTSRTQLKADVILILTRFKSHKIVTVSTGRTVCGLRVTVLSPTAVRFWKLKWREKYKISLKQINRFHMMSQRQYWCSKHGHVGVPNQSWGSWTLFLCERLLLFK